jgi:tetratricopeptide (TPR) repeat protein
MLRRLFWASTRVALLVCGLASPAPAADGVVTRGPSHEPVPYHFDPKTPLQAPRAFLEDGPACYLYAGSSTLIEADGTEEDLEHEIIRLNNRRGVELFGQYHKIAFDPTYQKITLHTTVIHKPNGSTVPVGPQHVQVRDSNTDYQNCERHQEVLISFPDLDEGDIIEVKWSTRGKDPELQGQYFNRYQLGDDQYPTVREDLYIRLPRGKPFRHLTTGGQLEPEVRDEGATRLYHWQAKLRPPLPLDEHAPGKEELRLQVHCSTFTSWDEVRDWYRQVRRNCWHCTQDLKEIVRECTRDAKTAEERARALMSWMRQHVRYLGLHARDTFAPWPASLVFQNRFGDCKDQSQLLAVLLQEAGIPAKIAILGWPDDGAVLENLPSPLGTHAIVMATIDGQERWLDPVMSFGAWNILVREDHDRLCYVMDATSPVQLKRTPPFKPEANRIEQTVQLTIDTQGNSHGESSSVHQGHAAEAERQAWQGLSQDGRRQRVLQEVQKIDDNAQLARFRVDERQLHDMEQPIRVEATFDIPSHFSSPNWNASLRDDHPWDCLLSRKAAPERKLPLMLDEPRDVRQKFVIRLPAAYRLGEPPSKGKAQSAWASYTRSVRYDAKQPRQLELEFHLRLEKTRVEPADFAAYRKFLKEVTELTTATVSLTSTVDPADVSRLEAELTRTPDDSPTAQTLTQIYLNIGKLDEARRVLERTLKQLPKDDELLKLQLTVAEELAKRTRAEQVKGHLQLAHNAFDRGEVQDAFREFQEASKADAECAKTGDALAFLGQIHERLGEAPKAKAAYQQWLTLQPAAPQALAALSRLALAEHDRAAALGWWRQYAAAAKDGEALLAAAELALRLEHLDDALDLAGRAQQQKKSVAAERVLGLAYWHKGAYSQAIKSLTAALDTAPVDGRVLECLLRARLLQGDLTGLDSLAGRIDQVKKPSAELQQLRNVVARLLERQAALEQASPIPAAMAAIWRRQVGSFVCGEWAYSSGRPTVDVEALLAPALAEGAEFGPALGLRGLLALEKGRLKPALADAERAIAAAPADMRGYYVRGRVRLERGAAGALEDLQKAAQLCQRQDAHVLHWLAAALQQAGHGPEALAAQREAVRLEPADAELAEQLRELERSSTENR